MLTETICCDRGFHTELPAPPWGVCVCVCVCMLACMYACRSMGIYVCMLTFMCAFCVSVGIHVLVSLCE